MNNVKTPISKDHKGAFGKPGSWVCRISYPDPLTGKRKQTAKGGFDTKAAAEKYAREKATQLDEGRTSKPGKHTVEDLYAALMAYTAQRLNDGKIVQATYDNYGKAWKRIQPIWGERKVESITRQDVLKYFDYIKNDLNYSRNLVRKNHTLLKLMFQNAFNNQMIPRDILATIPVKEVLPAAPTKLESERDGVERIKFFTQEQAQHFLSVLHDPNIASNPKYSTTNQSFNLFELMLRTGIRGGEAMGLCEDAIDLDKKQITIKRQFVKKDTVDMGSVDIYGNITSGKLVERTKSDAGYRTLDVEDATLNLLKRQIDRRDTMAMEFGYTWSNPDGLLFMGEYTVQFNRKAQEQWVLKPLCRVRSWVQVTRAMRKLCEIAELPKLTPHDLRHTFATIAIQAGVPLETVSKILGHSTYSLTADTYTHLTPKMASNAATAVSDLLS